MPPGFRRATAVLQLNGSRSLIYVEKNFGSKELNPDYLLGLNKILETASPAGALISGMGVVPFEETYFGALPKKAGEERLIVLFANLGKYKDHEFDGFFNAYDQLSEAEAQKEEQHSNEANIIYINGFRRDEAYTNGVIAHELQHLLTYDPSGDTTKDSWLSETLAEGAMLATGHFSDQLHVNQMAKSTGTAPLVSTTYVTYGVQLLFASFLLDSNLGGIWNLSELSRMPLKGRDAVESLFSQRTGNPHSFDAIYSNFVSYLFNSANYGWSLPLSWDRPSKTGISIPPIASYKTISAFPANIDGWVYPYAFVAVDLPSELPDSAKVTVDVIRPGPAQPEIAATSCARTASALWKPVGKKRIAVYAVGCEPKSKQDMLHFRLIITDQTSPKAVSPSTLTD